MVLERHGAQLAVEGVNAQGGIRGRAIEMVSALDHRSGVRAVEIAERFVRDERVVAVAGHTMSTTMLAAAPLYDRNHVAAVATMATAPSLTGISPWVFRIASSDVTLGADLGRLAVREGWGRIAIIHQNNPYGRALATAIASEHRSSGGAAASIYPIDDDEAGPVDLGVFVRTLRRHAPDALLIISSTAVGLEVIRAVRAHALRMPIVGSDGWSPDLIAAEPAADGVLIPAAFVDDEADAVGLAFRARFRERFGEEPGPYGAAGYDAMMAVLGAIREAGPSRAKVRTALASGSAIAQGATGPISFSSGDRAERVGGLVRVAGGRVHPYVRWGR